MTPVKIRIRQPQARPLGGERSSEGSRGSPKPESKEWNGGEGGGGAGILPDFIILPDGVTRRPRHLHRGEEEREPRIWGFWEQTPGAGCGSSRLRRSLPRLPGPQRVL